jgi:hypothetical protein
MPYEKIKNKYWMMGLKKMLGDVSFSLGIGFFTAGYIIPKNDLLLAGVIIIIFGAICRGTVLLDKSTFQANNKLKELIDKDYEKSILKLATKKK